MHIGRLFAANLQLYYLGCVSIWECFNQ